MKLARNAPAPPRRRPPLHHGRLPIVAAVLLGALWLGWPASAQAQFGRNQVQYSTFKWRTLNSAHFTIHYYAGTEEAARDAARIAERSYAYISQFLQIDFKERIPVLLYADHRDFRQNNVISGISEGTQGVTESFKQRIIMPMMPSMEEFSHVFTHELVHAFQFEMMGTGSSLNPMQWSPPLWMMEGMAEYISVGMNASTEIWIRDMVRQGEYMTLMKMEQVMDQRVYRLGQAIYHYLGEQYGQESVRRFFKETLRRRDWVLALKEVYNRSPQQMSEEWKHYLEVRYADDVASQDEAHTVASVVVRHDGLLANLNLTPSISPDGSYIAYVSTANLRDGVYVTDTETGESQRALARGGSSGSHETIDLFESTMSWSADGTFLAFVGSGGRHDVIHIMQMPSARIVERLRFPGISIISAALSPDGTRVAFSGMRNGQRDLYIADVRGGAPRPVTRDLFSYLHPAWSPDGRVLAVATDAGAPTSLGNLDFRGYRLALIDPTSGDLTMLTEGAWHDTNPVWSPEGRELAFLSNRTGVPQVFLYEFDSGIIRRVTNLATGVSGITVTSPAISWASGSGRLAFSSFREMGWDIYTMPDPRTAPTFGTLAVQEGTAAPFEPVWAEYALGDPETFEDQPYRPRLTADYFFGAGGFASNIGVLGDVIVGFSDMTANHTLTLYLGMMGSVERSNLQATYVNRTHRFNWALSLYQMRSDLGLSYNTLGSYTYFSRLFRGGALMGYYPFSTYSRVEMSIGVEHITDSIQVMTTYQPDQEVERFPSFTYGQISLSHVFDSALYFISGPIAGHRWRVTVDQSLGDLNATAFYGDLRKYFNIGQRWVLAGRSFGGALVEHVADPAFGSGRGFQIGGPTLVHGTEYGQLYGNRVVLQNLEFRSPLLPWLPIQYDFLGAALFVDAAAVWHDGATFDWIDPDFPRDVQLQNVIVGAMGAGVRANLGYFTIFLDWAYPTDFRGNFGQGRLQFAIGSIF